VSSKTAWAWTISRVAASLAGTVTLAVLVQGLLRPAAPGPKSPCAGLTLYAVLRELQLLLAVWTGACHTCRQPLLLTPT
jgi:hypothetical protein